MRNEQDYPLEASITRRLNESGCKNAIKVLEWAHIQDEGDSFFRSCYEFAEHGDLSDIITKYKQHEYGLVPQNPRLFADNLSSLLLPESFIWHVFYNIANALCYCRYGWRKSHVRSHWEEIVHGDLKPQNLLLSDPDSVVNPSYPCVKLADFGKDFGS